MNLAKLFKVLYIKVSLVLLSLCLVIAVTGCTNEQTIPNLSDNCSSISSATENSSLQETTEHSSQTTATPEPSETLNKISILINDNTLSATLVDNSSVTALKEQLQKGDIAINMSDYSGFEKVGSLGMSLPTNNENITNNTGDIVLYQGNSIVIFYTENSWSYTRLAKIDDISVQKLKKILGTGDVTVTISLVK